MHTTVVDNTCTFSCVLRKVLVEEHDQVSPLVSVQPLHLEPQPSHLQLPVVSLVHLLRDADAAVVAVDAGGVSAVVPGLNLGPDALRGDDRRAVSREVFVDQAGCTDVILCACSRTREASMTGIAKINQRRGGFGVAQRVFNGWLSHDPR